MRPSQLELENFQLGSARDLFPSAWKFYFSSKIWKLPIFPLAFFPLSITRLGTLFTVWNAPAWLGSAWNPYSLARFSLGNSSSNSSLLFNSNSKKLEQCPVWNCSHLSKRNWAVSCCPVSKTFSNKFLNFDSLCTYLGHEEGERKETVLWLIEGFWSRYPLHSG